MNPAGDSTGTARTSDARRFDSETRGIRGTQEIGETVMSGADVTIDDEAVVEAREETGATIEVGANSAAMEDTVLVGSRSGRFFLR